MGPYKLGFLIKDFHSVRDHYGGVYMFVGTLTQSTKSAKHSQFSLRAYKLFYQASDILDFVSVPSTYSVCLKGLATLPGLEPGLSAVTGRRFSQLNYRAKQRTLAISTPSGLLLLAT